MKCIYVAGPYSGPTAEHVEANVGAALDAGDRLEDAGIRAFVPHLSHFRHLRRARGYEEWMEIDFAWVRRCDALLRMPGASSGADREVSLALALSLPVFFSEAEAIRWAHGGAPAALLSEKPKGGSTNGLD